MSDKFVMSVRQAAELDHAFERHGWTPAEVKKLSQGDTLINVRRVLRGHAEIIVPEHIIDCDARPFIPGGWSVLPDDEQLPNRVRGGFNCHPGGMAFHFDKGQMDGRWINGHELRKKLVDVPVLGANVLDDWLTHPHLIPEECKGKAVFFWGTIYRTQDRDLCVRSLIWGGGRWNWDASWLSYDWYDDGPAAVPAS